MSTPSKAAGRPDFAIVGSRIRHERRHRGLTLAGLADAVGSSPSHLSQVEQGHREPTLRLLLALSEAFEVTVEDLLRPEAPSRRAALEIAVARAQGDQLYRELGLPPLPVTPRLPTVVLEHVSALYDELRRRSQRVVATPEEARAANRALRERMRAQDNYFPRIERRAAEVLAAVGYAGGPLTQQVLLEVAAHCGFRLRYVSDLPRSVRSIADMRHGRLFLRREARTGAHDRRSVLLQAIGHFVLQHGQPEDFGDYLRQRTEANYFAAAMLLPERVAVPLLQQAKAARAISIEELRDAFGVSFEMAAHRFTNLATRHLDLRVHFVRTDEDGRIYKAYENDGLVFPADSDGAIEGQRACRYWSARRVFTATPRRASYGQFTDTPSGSYWCSSTPVRGDDTVFAVTVGVPFRESRWFRDRDTAHRATSTCPDPSCCSRPPRDLAARWDRLAWPSARAQSHVLAAMPPGSFPGVDVTDVYLFLDRHAADQ